METFKILGLLLTYPQERLYRASEEIVALVRAENLLPGRTGKRIEAFLGAQRHRDLLEAQEEYVETFDRGQAHCLHLFEHIHGESRDRGQAMVDLSETYAAKGLYIDGNELPDYLPMFMEYLSRCSLAEASDLLGEAIDVIAAIGARLRQRGSPYAAVFEAIEALSAVKPNQAAIKNTLAAAPKDPQTFQELDEEWREAEAFSGNPLADCDSCSTLANSFPNAARQLEKWIGMSR